MTFFIPTNIPDDVEKRLIDNFSKGAEVRLYDSARSCISSLATANDVVVLLPTSTLDVLHSLMQDSPELLILLQNTETKEYSVRGVSAYTRLGKL